MFADPAVFSGSLGDVLRDDMEASGSGSWGFLSPLDHMRSVVQHTIQAGLGEKHCHGPKLAQVLRVSGAGFSLLFYSTGPFYSNPFVSVLLYSILVESRKHLQFFKGFLL